MNKKTKIILLISLCLIILFSFVYINISNNVYTYVTYKEFYEMIDNKNEENYNDINKKINEVTFSENKIYFTLSNDDEKYYTDNSNSDSLKEKLLLNDIKVNEETSLEDLLVEIFDIIFILIFLIAIVVVLRRVSGKSIFKVTKKEKTKFSDVVGMDDLKNEMMQIVDIMKNKNDYLKKGIRQPKGIILEGEPGNGKTLFARALAGEANMNFIATKGADFESAVMAIGPAKIHSLFRIARRLAPVIIFIDEFDGIGTKRNYSGSAIETENTRIVTALLNELDGFKENSEIFVIAATNNSKVLDPALIRAGRFDRKYLITYPNQKDRIDLIKYYSKNMKLDEKIDIEKLALLFNGASSSKIATIINEAGIIAERKNNGIISSEIIKEAIEITREK